MSPRIFTPDDIIYPEGNRPSIRIDKKYFRYFFIGVLILGFLSLVRTLFYTVEPNEVGVVLRFGKFISISTPGLHFKLPLGIDKVRKVKVEFVYKQEFGFRTKEAGRRTLYEEKEYPQESLMLTGDLNVLNVEWVVQYKIKDPVKFLFNIRDPISTLRDISESVMREIVGDYTFDEVLTIKRAEINDLAQQKMQKILDSYGVGIQIVAVKLQDVNPPQLVQSAFNEVNQAKQEREKMINQAWEIYNKEVPKARGEALRKIKEAEGYAIEKINKAQGDAKRFLLLLEAYREAKDITKKRLYLESMQEILKKVGKKYIIDSEQKSLLPFLKLNDER